MHHSVRRTRSRWTTRLRVTSAKLRRPNTTSTTLAWMATSAAWVRGQTVNLPAGYMPSHAKLHTHTRLTALFPGLPGWAGTTEVKPIWILLDQEAVSGSGISWAVCKSAPRSRQITMPVPHCQYPTTQFFTGRMPFLLPNQQHQSTEGNPKENYYHRYLYLVGVKLWRHWIKVSR